MADVKPVVKFKTYKQAARVGGKIYGVANLADPVVAPVTMQEVIDYAKLHNYSAATLEALLSQVISGVAELVARDGRPRNLSDLLKFEPAIKGTFANLEQGITNQKIVVRPRMLKEIKVNVASDAFSWQNQNDTTAPKIVSAAPDSPTYPEITLAAVQAGIAAATGFGWTLAGTRLCPNGWDASCKFEVVLKQGEDEYHLEHADVVYSEEEGHYTEEEGGYIRHVSGDEATENALYLSFATGSSTRQAWTWGTKDGQPAKIAYDGEVLPIAGDQFIFRFTRTTGSGDTFTAEKAYTL